MHVNVRACFMIWQRACMCFKCRLGNRANILHQRQPRKTLLRGYVVNFGRQWTIALRSYSIYIIHWSVPINRACYDKPCYKQVPYYPAWKAMALYSKTCLRRTCSKADICLKGTKDFAQKFQFIGQSLINLNCLKHKTV